VVAPLVQRITGDTTFHSHCTAPCHHKIYLSRA